jgi:hypothetical protein
MKVHAVIITGVVALLSPMHAGPPLLTDDPFTPGPGKWEINLSSTAERNEHAWLISAPILDLNYGWGERVQLKFKAPYLFSEDTASDTSSWGNVEVGIKWRFYESENESWFASTYPQMAFPLTSASARRGLTEEGYALSLPFQVAWRSAAWTIYTELGWKWIESGPDVWFLGCAAEYELAKGVILLGEIRAEMESSASDAVCMLNIGTKTALFTNASLLASAGCGLSDSSPDFLAYLGIQLTL